MKPKTILWIILAALGGEVALALFTTVAQEVLFGGIDFYTSSLFDMVFGGLATFMAAILAGSVASMIIKNRNYWPHVLISLLVVAEMSYLISKGRTSGPLWFSIASGLSLILGVWFGYYLMRKWAQDVTAITS